MSTTSKPRDAVPVAGTARGRRLSAGHAKPIGSASTPESKPKSTPDKKSTSGQSQTPVKVPHYLRASTGSCHDFCKYGGRHAAEEEEGKFGSHSSKKKSGLTKGPKWKDIISYDAMAKIGKPQVVPLVSKKVAVPTTKPKLERPTISGRPNLQRRTSLEASCSGTKLVVVTPVKISSAPPKIKAGKPGIIRKDSPTISNRPKIQKRNEQKVNKGATGIVRNCAEVDMEPTGIIDGNGGDGGVERTLYVVEPELELKLVQVDLDSYKVETIEELKPDFKETIKIDFGTEGGKGVETNEVSKCEEEPELELKLVQVDLDSYKVETIEELKPDFKETIEIDFGTEGENEVENNEVSKCEEEPELELKLVQVDLDSYKVETIEELKPDCKETIAIGFGTEGENVVENNEVSKCEDSDIGKALLECPLNETEKPIQENSTPLLPDKKFVAVESESELTEKSKNSEQEDEAILKSGSISNESGEKFEPESESEFESSCEAEQSVEFESESESGSISGSGFASSGSVECASKVEKSKVERSSRRSGSNQLEEEKPHKLKFKPVRVIESKPDSDSGPRRLKFRKPRVVVENPKSSGNGRKVSYRKQSGSDVIGSNSVDPKSAGLVLRHQDGQERMEGQNGLFNNVIEETASKLVKSRKSKVKALVGAFETVISLQDHGKPSSTA